MYASKLLSKNNKKKAFIVSDKLSDQKNELILPPLKETMNFNNSCSDFKYLRSSSKDKDKDKKLLVINEQSSDCILNTLNDK